MQSYSESLTTVKVNTLQTCFENTEGMISFEEALLLYKLAKSAMGGCIVEVGSYRGRSSVFLGLGSIDGAGVPVYAIDPHKKFTGVLGGVFGPKDRTEFYRAMLSNKCSEIVSLINLSSDKFCKTWNEPISLLWIDGDHSYNGVKNDFDSWINHMQPDGLIAFDDATDKNLGPHKLIDELIESGLFAKVTSVGKVIVIEKVNHK